MRLLALLLALFVSTAEAQIVHDATSSQSFNLVGASTASYTHTSVGTPSAAICLAFFLGTAAVSATYGGAAMTEQADWTAATGSRLFYKTSPATGAQTVEVDFGGATTQKGTITCMTVTGTANPPFVVGSNVSGFTTGGFGGYTGCTVDVNTTDRGANDWLLVEAFIYQFGSPETVTQTTDTQMSNDSLDDGFGVYQTHLVSREVAGGNGQISYTWTTAGDCDAYAISLEAASSTRIRDVIGRGMVPKRR